MIRLSTPRAGSMLAAALLSGSAALAEARTADTPPPGMDAPGVNAPGVKALGVNAPGVDAPESDAVLRAARMYLMDELHRLRPDIRRLELMALGHPTARLPRGAEVVASADALHGKALSARVCVWVEVRRDGRAIESVPTWFAVQAFRPVLVAQHNRTARDDIQESDLTVEERDVAVLTSLPLEVDTDLARMRLRRAISPGRVLLKSDVEERPTILRGQDVAVEVRYGSVAIETRAVALKEARLGDAVVLRNPVSDMTYSAQVIGPGRAAVSGP